LDLFLTIVRTASSNALVHGMSTSTRRRESCRKHWKSTLDALQRCRNPIPPIALLQAARRKWPRNW
jgi:hypothetical protein